MNKEKIRRRNAKALEDAAKYICTMKSGLCPMAVGKSPPSDMYPGNQTLAMLGCVFPEQTPIPFGP